MHMRLEIPISISGLAHAAQHGELQLLWCGDVSQALTSSRNWNFPLNVPGAKEHAELSTGNTGVTNCAT